MESCLTPTISGFNEQVQTVKLNEQQSKKEADDANKDTGPGEAKKEADEYFVSVVKFNHAVTPMQWNKPAGEINELTTGSYAPIGSTAMLDAVGQTIENLSSEADTGDPNTSFLVVILSDGLENASKEWSYSRLGEKIQTLKATGRWTFTYMGANQDLSVIRDTLNIDAGNIALYTADSTGTEAAFGTSNRSTANYFRARKLGVRAVNNFYSKDGKIADLTKKDSK
jgi:hypothetical protein